jgi:cobalt-zinc-cadmium efflux system protein
MTKHTHSHDGHGHRHDHGHSHAPASFGVAFAVGTALNIALVIIQAVCGVLANSVALLADASHNLGDVIGLLIAWGASSLTRRPPTARYTYGLRSSSILAALINAIVLLLVTGGVAWEAILRLGHPEPVASRTVMAAAAAGLVINGGVAMLFMSGRKGDMNIRGAFLHMLADAGLSFGVLVSALIIELTEALWLDPLASLGISGVIVWGSWGLLRDALDMALHAAPKTIDTTDVRRFLTVLPGVARIHDLHVWSMSTTETALTCHLVTPGGHPGDAFVADVALELSRAFGIGHVTLQIELGDGRACALEPDHTA